MMGKKESVFSLTIFLLAASAICGALVSYVNGMTGTVIAKMEADAILSGYTEVFPGIEKVIAAPYDGKTAGIKDIQMVMQNGQQSGIIYNVSSNGYAGAIELLVGFDSKNGKITGIKVMKQGETPGLGANCTSPKFTGQFAGKSAASALSVVKNPAGAPSEIQAITASTITSRAVVLGVNTAREHFTANFAGK